MKYDSLDEALAGVEVRDLLWRQNRDFKYPNVYRTFVDYVNTVSDLLSTFVPYYAELESLSLKLEEEFDTFPDECCTFTSKIVSQLYSSQYNFEEIGGYYFNGFVRNWEQHAWNYDAERKLYVDLTLYQFEEHFPRVVVLPSVVSSVFYKDWSLSEKQRCNRYDEVERFIYDYVSLKNGKKEELKDVEN